MQQAVQTTKISRTLDLAYMALGAVVIAVCAWISIPAAVPFTMQTFAVFFVLLFSVIIGWGRDYEGENGELVRGKKERKEKAAGRKSVVEA